MQLAPEIISVNAESSIVLKKDWALANPWPWLAGGIGLALWSWLWALTFKDTATDNRVIVLAVGLLVGAIGLWLRWSDRQSSQLTQFCPAGVAQLLRLGMALFYLVAATGITALLVMTIIEGRVGVFRPGVTTMLWLTIAPLSFYAARRAGGLQVDRPALDADDETGLAFFVAGLTAGLGSLALDLGPGLATDWDTIRVALRVLSAVALAGGALAVVSLRVRRLVLSLIFSLHFFAIGTATLSAPPYPLIAQAAATRLARPYLEFMYLINAYHFYAPDPGPQSNFWFRVIFADESGKEVGMWYKTPYYSENGQPQHPAMLDYLRYVVIGESLVPVEAAPPPLVPDNFGRPSTNPIYYRRADAAQSTLERRIGLMNDKQYPRIPTHPQIPFIQQLQIPGAPQKMMAASYARHVAHKFAVHPEHPELKFKSVKFYRVVHMIPQPIILTNGLPPDDPELYRPIFMGNFDVNGEILESDQDDPYLYWLLPIVRVRPADPYSPIKDWARMHAGDPNWIRHTIVNPVTAEVVRYVWSDSMDPPAGF